MRAVKGVLPVFRNKDGGDMKSLLSLLGKLARKVPYLKEVFLERDNLRAKLAQLNSQSNPFLINAPPGHYSSPIPCLDDIRSKEAELFSNAPKYIAGSDRSCIVPSSGQTSEYPQKYLRFG